MINIVKKLTPVFAGVFLFIFSNTYSWGSTTYPEETNLSTQSTKNVYPWAGIKFEMYQSNNSIPVKNLRSRYIYSGGLYFSESFPILSRLEYKRSNHNKYKDTSLNKNDSYEKYFTELKSPFKISFFSTETPIYLLYAYEKSTLTGKAKNSFHTTKGIVAKEGDFSYGEESNFVALAINTPFTHENSPNSLSRFGIFYKVTKRPVVLDVDSLKGKYMVKTNENKFGVFYEVNNPIFIENLILSFNLNVAIGNRNVYKSGFDIKKDDYKASRLIVFNDISLGLSYNFILNDNLYINLGTRYDFSSYTSLATASNVGDANGNTQKYGAIINFYINL